MNRPDLANTTISVVRQHKLNREKWNPKGLERSINGAKSAKQKSVALFFGRQGVETGKEALHEAMHSPKSRGVALPEPRWGLFCVFLLSVAVGNLSIRSGVFRVLGRSSDDLRFRVAGCPGCQASAGLLRKPLVVHMPHSFHPPVSVTPAFSVRDLPWEGQLFQKAAALKIS